ncbi:MAG: PorT family protein [Cyclobacteriaceae bacterium]|nr:PorT family protein [Cyclobacteriaceae bacterium]
MFRYLIICLFIALFAVDGVAQVTVGLHGGANFSRMDFTNNPEYKFTEIKAQSGFLGGVVVQFIPEKHAGLQAEFNYSQKGWIEMDTTMGKELQYKNKLDYVELPILTHINIGAGNFRGLLNLGPYLGYALNSSTKLTNLQTGTSQTTKHDFDNDKDNRIDFGLLLGFGFEYRLALGKLAIEARYSIGLGDLNKDKASQSEVSQFRVLGVLLRYSIPLQARESKTDQQ